MKIYLCDLAHDGGSEVIPYAVGCIGSYAKKMLNAEVHLFKFVSDLDKAMRNEAPPDVIGFSNYMWNTNLSAAIARKIADTHQSITFIGGGPDIPGQEAIEKKWLAERTYDLYVKGEGECPFVAAIEGDWNPEPLKDLNDIPSPYLTGMLDEFLDNPHLTPIMETNRGCPFTCTFCVDGLENKKVRKFSLDRLEQEIEYIAARSKTDSLFIADTNFGMYPEDVIFSKMVQKTQEKYGYPKYINASTGKNHKERVIEVAKNMNGALRVAASVQSMNAEVLKNIKRKNISLEEIIGVAKELKDTNSNTYSEVIQGLPGETVDSYIDGVLKLVDAGFDQIRMHQLTILNGSELEQESERVKFGMVTSRRILQRSFGLYEFNGEELCIGETEDIVTKHDAMSVSDYYHGRQFALTVALLYNERAFFELDQLMKCIGLKYADFLRYAHEDLSQGHNAEVSKDTIDQFYLRFALDSVREFDQVLTKEAIQEGHIGNNLLYNTQGEIYYHYFIRLTDRVFYLAKKYISERVPVCQETTHILDYLYELRRYTYFKKGFLQSLNAVSTSIFEFDFIFQEEEGFTRIPEPCRTRIEFYYEDWQKEFFSKQIEQYGSTPKGLGKLIARCPMRHTHRKVKLQER